MNFTRRLFATIVFSLALAVPAFGAAQTGFAGVTTSSLFLNDSGDSLTLIFVGAQVGSYDFLGPLGGRVTAEASVTPVAGLLSGTADLMFASSGSTKVYAGAGFGILSLLDVSAPVGKVFAGVDIALGSPVSLFVEASPVYSFATGNAFFSGKFGINFHFGNPTSPTARRAAANEADPKPEDDDSVWLEPYDPDADPNG